MSPENTFLALRSDFSVIHPTHAQRAGDPIVYIGCSFVVRARDGRIWLLFPAHLLSCGAALDALDQWPLEVNVRFANDRPGISLPLFLGRDRQPLFKGPPGGRTLADIVALPLDDAWAQLIGETDFIDLSRDCPSELQSGSSVIFRGYPYIGGMWPSPYPLAMMGTARDKHSLALLPIDGVPLPGFSGTAVFGIDGLFGGMLIAAKDDRGFVLPADFIWRFVNDELPEHDELPYRLADGELLMRVAGLVNASNIIADNVIVTDHLTTNSVTEPQLYALGAQSRMTSPASTITTSPLSASDYGGYTIQLNYTDSITRDGGHSPTFYAQIYRYDQTLGTTTLLGTPFLIGGSGAPAVSGISAAAQDTIPSSNGPFVYGAQITASDGSGITPNASTLWANIFKK